MTSARDPHYAWLLLRIALGGQFVAAGLFSVVNWAATVEFNAALAGQAAAPAFTAAAVALLVVGGLSLVFAFHPRLGAVVVLAFLVPASIRHVLVAMDVTAMASDPATAELASLAKRGQLASLAKNIALIGVVGFVALRGVHPPRHPIAQSEDSA